jgi:hypothetical protein
MNGTRYRADLSIVKQRAIIWTLVGVVVLIGVLVVVFVPGRERVSLTFLNYQRTPYGATLKLSNDTSKTITYLTDQRGGLFLFLRKTPGGWTNTSLPITRVMIGTTPGYVFADPAIPLKPNKGGFIEVVRSRELNPGESTEVHVRIEPDALPMRAGVLCCVRQGAVAKRFEQSIGWIKRWCHLKSKPPGQMEVWCSEPLQGFAKPTRAEKE